MAHATVSTTPTDILSAADIRLLLGTTHTFPDSIVIHTEHGSFLLVQPALRLEAGDSLTDAFDLARLWIEAASAQPCYLVVPLSAGHGVAHAFARRCP